MENIKVINFQTLGIREISSWFSATKWAIVNPAPLYKLLAQNFLLWQDSMKGTPNNKIKIVLSATHIKSALKKIMKHNT